MVAVRVDKPPRPVSYMPLLRVVPKMPKACRIEVASAVLQNIHVLIHCFQNLSKKLYKKICVKIICLGCARLIEHHGKREASICLFQSTAHMALHSVIYASYSIAMT